MIRAPALGGLIGFVRTPSRGRVFVVVGLLFAAVLLAGVHPILETTAVTAVVVAYVLMLMPVGESDVFTNFVSDLVGRPSRQPPAVGGW